MRVKGSVDQVLDDDVSCFVVFGLQAKVNGSFKIEVRDKGDLKLVTCLVALSDN